MFFSSSDAHLETLFRLIVSDINHLDLNTAYLFWHSFWHIFRHSFWRAIWHLFFLAYILTSFWHSIWYIIFRDSLWLRSGGEHFDPELAVRVRQGTLRSRAVRRGILRSRAWSWGRVEEAEEEEPADIESNNPHLTAGEKWVIHTNWSYIPTFCLTQILAFYLIKPTSIIGYRGLTCSGTSSNHPK